MLPTKIVSMAIALSFGFLLIQAARSGFDHDEIEHLHAAWLVKQGQVPYRDFVENHPPCVHYLLAPLTRVFEGLPHALVFAARILDLALLGIALAVFVALVKPVLRSKSAGWTAILLVSCFLFVRNSMEVRPDPWMSLLSLIGLWQWCRYLRGAPWWHAAIAGLSFGIATAFLQKAAAFIGLVGVAAVLAPRLNRGAWAHLAKGAAVVFAAATLPLAAFALAVWRAGYWNDFLFWNYTFNRFYSLEMNAAGVPSPAATLAVSIAEDPLLWIGGAFGLAITLRSILHRNAEPEMAAASCIVVGIVAALFRSHWPFSHNLLLMQPSLALLAAIAVDRISSQGWRSLIAALLLLSVAKAATLSLVYTEAPNSGAVQDLLLASTRPSDPVAVPPPYNPIFRPNAFYFWYNSTSFSSAYLECCRRYRCPIGKVNDDRRAWQQGAPIYVYLPPDEPGWAPFEFANHEAEYRRTEVPGLWRLATPQIHE